MMRVSKFTTPSQQRCTELKVRTQAKSALEFCFRFGLCDFHASSLMENIFTLIF